MTEKDDRLEAALAQIEASTPVDQAVFAVADDDDLAALVRLAAAVRDTAHPEPAPRARRASDDACAALRVTSRTYLCCSRNLPNWRSLPNRRGRSCSSGCVCCSAERRPDRRCCPGPAHALPLGLAQVRPHQNGRP